MTAESHGRWIWSSQTDYGGKTMTDEPDLTLRILTAVARIGQHDTIWWRVDGGYAPITFFAMCNDLFEWGTADLEPITAANVEQFERAIEDVMAASDGDGTYAAALYACRMRQQRPQGAAYPTDTRLWPLFDACGPERELDRANPLRPTGELVAYVLEPLNKAGLGAAAAAAGEPAVVIGTAEVEPPCHPPVQPASGGPDHCGLCGAKYPTIDAPADDTPTEPDLEAVQ